MSNHEAGSAARDQGEELLSPNPAHAQILQQLVSVAPTGIGFYEGPDFILRFINKAGGEVLGGRAVVGKSLFEFAPEIKDTPAHEALRRGLRGEEHSLRAFPVPLNRDGAIRPYYFNLATKPVSDGAGATIGVMLAVVEVTDQVVARQRAEELAMLNGIITDNATLGLLMMNDQSECTFMNPAAEEITGYTFEEVRSAGKPLHEIVHYLRPDGSPYPMRECPIDRALPEKNRTQGEDVFVRPDGSFYSVAFTASPILRGGRPVGTVIEVRDTTEEKRIQAAIQESQERFRAVFDQAAVGISVFSKNGKRKMANDAYAQMLGYSAEELLETSVHDVTHPEDRAVDEEKFKGLIRGDAERSVWEKRYVHRDGSIVWGIVYATVLHDGQGRPKNVISAVQDITERVRAAQELRDEKEQLELAQRAGGIGTFEIDGQTGRITWSRELERLYGLAPGSFKGTTEAWYAFVHPDDRPQVERKIAEAIKRRDPGFEAQWRIIRPSGEVRYIAGRSEIFYRPDHRMERILGVNIDVTERTKLERQKDEFIAIAGHELKTPITSIKAYAQALRRRLSRSGDEASARNLARIEAQVDKLSALISDLLEVPKLESGQLVMRPERYDFDAMVRETVEALQVSSEGHKLIVEGASGVTVYGDRERAGQVLTNLLTNAIKYSPGRDKVLVRLGRKGADAEACIQDFGAGIADEELPYIFDRFYRTGVAKKASAPGMGLGLYISSQITAQMGGTIKVKSKVGEGSTFCLRLLADKSNEQKADA